MTIVNDGTVKLTSEQWASIAKETDRLVARVNELEALINTPEIDDFLKGVVNEAAHQRVRWGAAHDREKSPQHWFWLVGYLAGKALAAAMNGNREKALHHCISTAAALMHWHTTIKISPVLERDDPDLAAHDQEPS